jgi:hypothetical protein
VKQKAAKEERSLSEVWSEGFWVIIWQGRGIETRKDFYLPPKISLVILEEVSESMQASWYQRAMLPWLPPHSDHKYEKSRSKHQRDHGDLRPQDHGDV